MRLTLLLLLAPTLAFAHKPSYDVGGWDSPESPYPVEDTQVSIAVYAPVTCESPELWLEFDGLAGDPLYVQLGVPLISRLVSFRPMAAILAPGLPEPPDDLPFAVPEGLGVQLLGPHGDERPEIFFEPFTGTESWVHGETTIYLPEDGAGYVVAWDPDATTGKLWLAVGTVEEFGPDDFAFMGEWTQRTRAFHEHEGYEPTEPTSNDDCVTEEPAAGCAVAPGVAGWLPLLLLGWRRSPRQSAKSTQ